MRWWASCQFTGPLNGDGARRSRLQVVADDVDFLAKPQGENGSGDVGEVADRPAMSRYRHGNGKARGRAR